MGKHINNSGQVVPPRPADIPVHNPGTIPLYVGSAMVAPGETRIFPAHLVPAHLRPDQKQAEQEQQADPLQELLKKSVKDLLPLLPEISLEALVRLEQLEQAGQARKTLLEPITVERLTRAANAELEAFKAEIAALPEEELLARLETVGDDAAKLEALQAELDKRADNAP